jgi:hypothetical protein
MENVMKTWQWILCVISALGVIALGVLGVVLDLPAVYLPCIGALTGVLAAVAAKLRAGSAVAIAVGIPSAIAASLFLASCAPVPKINTGCLPEVAARCIDCGRAIASCVEEKP